MEKALRFRNYPSMDKNKIQPITRKKENTLKHENEASTFFTALPVLFVQTDFCASLYMLLWRLSVAATALQPLE